MVVENSIESHTPVEIDDLLPLTMQDRGGYPSPTQPGAESTLTSCWGAGKGKISLLAGLD